jgi:hypothetical protein
MACGEWRRRYLVLVLHCIAVLNNLSIGCKFFLVVDRMEVGFDIFEYWLCIRQQKATMHAIECSSVVAEGHRELGREQ